MFASENGNVDTVNELLARPAIDVNMKNQVMKCYCNEMLIISMVLVCNDIIGW